MTNQQKQTLIEIMNEVLKDEKEEYRLYFTHHYLHKHIKVDMTFKDYYDIMVAISFLSKD